MSKTVDERVVSMQFDNGEFERNVQTSMSTLDKLKHSLKLDGVAKGFDDINSAAKKCDVSPLGKGIEAVQAKFSALEVMGVTALANLTNSAVNAGKRIVSALTIDPIKSGFQEYETQINAIQTILANTASKGTTLDDVNKALDTLNLYADKTIYNFTEMTRNIGTFTAAGIDLDTATNAIQGIANLAAVSGSTSQQASTAMYQLSQALASGTVKLMDWNSVVNAGMGGEVFQNALKETARVHGIEIDRMIESEGSFRETLRAGWLTSEVLTETLAKFTMTTEDLTEAEIAKNREMLRSKGYTEDQIEAIFKLGKTATDAATKVKTFTQLFDTLKEAAQSGWTQTWESIVGDFEEAKAFMTDLSDTIGGLIGKSANNRNAIVELAFGSQESKWDSFIKKINDAGIATDSLTAKLKETASEHGISLDELIKKEGSLAKVITSGKLGSGIIIETLKKFIGVEKEVGSATTDMTDKLDYFNKIVGEVIRGDFGVTEERYKALAEAGYDAAQVQTLVNTVWKRNGYTWTDCTLTAEELTQAIASMSDSELKSIGYTEEQAKAIRELAEEAEKTGTPINELIASLEKPSGRTLLIDSIKNALAGFMTVLDTVKKAWTDTFYPGVSEEGVIQKRADGIYKILEAIHSFSKILNINEKSAEKLRRTFKGLFAVLDLIRTVFGGALRIVFDLAKKVLDNFNLSILDVTASIGDALVAVSNWVKEHDFIGKAIQKVADFISSAIINVKDWIGAISQMQLVKDIVSVVADTFAKWYERIKDFFSGGIKTVANFFSSLTENFSFGEGVLSDFIKRLKEFDSTLTLDDMIAAFKEAKDAVTDFVSNLDFGFGNIKTIFSKIKEFFTNLFGNIDFSGVTEAITSFTIAGNKLNNISFSNIGSSISKTLSSIGDWFSKTIKKIEPFIEMVRDKIPGAIAVGMGALSLVAVAKLGDALETLLKPVTGLIDVLGNVAETISKVGKSLSKYLKAKAFNQVTIGIKNIAISVLLLAVSLAILSKLNQDNLWSSVGAVVVLLGVITALATAISKIDKFGDFGKTSGAVLGLAAALLIMVYTIKLIADLDGESILKGIIVIGILELFIFALIGISKKAGPYADKAGKMMMSVAIALAIMAYVIKIIGKMDPEVILKGLLTIGVLELFMVALIKVTKKAGPEAGKLGGLLISFGVSLFLLAATLKIIGGMTTKELEKGLIVIGVLEIFIASLILISQKYSGQIGKVGGMLVGLGFALLLTVAAMKIIGGMTTEELEKGIVVVGVLELFMAGLIAVSKFAGENAGKAGLMLLAVSAALLILTGVLYLLNGLSVEELTKTIAAISVMEIMFGGLIAVSKLAGDNLSTIIALTVAVAVLAAAIFALSTIDDQDSLKNATMCLSMVMGVFALLIAATGLIKTEKWGAQIAILATMTLVVAAIAGILVMLSSMDTQPSIETALSLSVLLVAMSAALLMLSKSNIDFKKALEGILSLTAMIIPLLAFALALLGIQEMGLQLEGMEHTLLILLGVITAMTLLLLPLTLVGKQGAAAIIGVGSLTAMVVPLCTFAFALAKIQEGGIDFAGMEQTLLILLSVITAMTLLLIPLTLIGLGGPAAIIGVGSLTAMVVPLIAFAFAISILPDLTGTLMSITTVLMVMKAMVEMLKPLTLIGLGGPAALIGVGSLTTMVVPLIAFAWAISELPDLTLTLPSLMILLMAMNSFVDMLKPLTLIGLGGPAAITGVGSLVTLIGAIGGMAVGVGKLMDTFPELKKFMDIGIPILEQLAEGLGRMIGKFIGGIVGGALESISESLSKFMENIKGFIDGAKDISPDVASGIKALASAILVITAADILNGIASFITGGSSMEDFGKSLSSFGEGIKGFSDSISGLTEEDLKKVDIAAKAGERMAKMADSIPKKGGWAQDILGETDMVSFSEGISEFGTAIVSYAQTVKELTADDSKRIEDSAKSGEAMSELQNSVPKTGGWAQIILGKSDMQNFADGIAIFGEAICAYALTVRDLNSDDKNRIDDSAAAGKALSGVQESIPKTGGLWQLIAGKSDMEKFSTGIVMFGEALIKYINTISSINDESIESIKKSGEAVDALIDVVDKVPTTEGLWNAIAGEKDVGGFGSAIKALGDGIKKYISSVSGITDDSLALIEKSGSALDKIVTVSKKVPKNDDEYKNGTSFLSSMRSIASGILAYLRASVGITLEKINTIDNSKVAISKLSDVAAELDDFSSDDIAMAAEQLADLTRILSNFSTINYNDIVTFKKSIEELGTVSLDNFINVFKNSGPEVSAVISDLMSNVANSIKKETTKIRNAFKETLTAIITYMNSQKVQFSQSGNNLIVGISEAFNKGGVAIKAALSGILSLCKTILTSNNTAFSNSGTALINCLKQSFSNGGSALKASLSGTLTSCVSVIKSFYSGFYNAGVYVAKGFATGIQSDKSTVSAVKDMATRAVNAAKKTLIIKSPSHVFEKLGQYVPKGFAKGIDAFAYLAAGSITSMTEATVNSAEKSLSNVGRVISGGMNMSPSIRPVVDMSSVGRTKLNLNTSISASVIKPVDSLSRMVANAQADINTSNDKVISSINDLRSDLATLYSKEDPEIALYVDAKKLATSIAKPMDRQLNILSKKGAY